MSKVWDQHPLSNGFNKIGPCLVLMQTNSDCSLELSQFLFIQLEYFLLSTAGKYAFKILCLCQKVQFQLVVTFHHHL